LYLPGEPGIQKVRRKGMKNFSKHGILMLATLGLMISLFAGCENPAGNGGESRAGIVGIDINSAAQLALIGTSSSYPANGQYRLTTNITLTNWTPVLSVSGNPFTGTFDGNGKTITLNSFDRTFKGSSLGIFGYITGQSASATIRNLTVVIDIITILQGTASYVGGLAGYIENANLNNVDVVVNGDKSGSLAYTGFITLYIGGAAGYLKSSAMVDCDATELRITGTSLNNEVYAGGLVGYGDAAKFTNCTATKGQASLRSEVSSNGFGHNTSGGGIAGYLTNGSRVTSCVSNSTIAVNAPGGTSVSTAYMSYAGGLVGYTGNGTVTSESGAEGPVSAASPYPYAGGLVGYNYGVLDTSHPSTISQCYATGAVSSKATYGRPYAGGLAGYNSGNGATIEDSYATGNVSATSTDTGSAWAGGIVSANVTGSIVKNCYATGTVTATATEGPLPSPDPDGAASDGAWAGGIVGHNYSSDAPSVQYCVALNSRITGTATGTTDISVSRIVGNNGNTSPTTLTENYGSTAMTLNPYRPFIDDVDDIDGGDCDAVPDQTPTNWYVDTLGWNFSNVWKVGSPYPRLQWQP
jgi:hypothetical protein